MISREVDLFLYRQCIHNSSKMRHVRRILGGLERQGPRTSPGWVIEPRRMKAVVFYGSIKGDLSIEWSSHESRAKQSSPAESYVGFEYLTCITDFLTWYHTTGMAGIYRFKCWHYPLFQWRYPDCPASEPPNWPERLRRQCSGVYVS